MLLLFAKSIGTFCIIEEIQGLVAQKQWDHEFNYKVWIIYGMHGPATQSW